MNLRIDRGAISAFAGPTPTLGMCSVTPPADIERDVLDWPFYRDTSDALGAELTDELLGQLAGLMRERLSLIKTLVDDPSQLAREAHGLASAICMLGFSELTDAYRSLEATCHQGGNVSALLQRLNFAHERALRMIVSLRQAA